MTPMRKKAVGAVLAAAALVAMAILYGTLQPDTRRIEGILAAYQEHLYLEP